MHQVGPELFLVCFDTKKSSWYWTLITLDGRTLDVPELVLQPGSGTWRASATELFYAPMRGEDVRGQTVVEVPVSGTLINVYAANVSLNNIVVKQTAGELQPH